MKCAAAAWAEKDKWKSILMEAYSLTLAGRNPYIETNGGPKPMNLQFDSTAPNAVMRAANRILMGFFPPDQSWVDVKPGPLLEMKLANNKPVLEQLKGQLASCTSMLSMVFSSGNFINTVWEMILDLLISGLGIMLVLEDPQDDVEPSIFQSVSQSEVAIRDDARGNAAELFRKRKMRPSTFADVWDDAKLNPELRKLAKEAEEREVELQEITYRIVEKRQVKWYYEVLYKGTDGDAFPVVQREYDSNPWQVFRWSKLPGCPYGPGPVLLALADIRTLNKIVEMVLKNAALSLAGMYLVRDDGVLNPDNVVITSGGMIPVAATGGSMGASMTPLETGRDFSLPQLVMEKLQSSIRAALFDNDLPDMDSTARSPTEIMQRVRQMTQNIGGAVGRLSVEVVHLVRRVMELLSKRGFLPPLKIDQFTLKVQVNSPLAKARQMDEVQTVVQWWQMAVQMGGPQAAMLAGKIEDILPWIADKMGVPIALIRSATERMALQQQMAGIVAQQQAAPDMVPQAA
jgi:hypothetical protein